MIITLLIIAYSIVNVYIIYRANIYLKDINNKLLNKQVNTLLLIGYLIFSITPLLAYIMPVSNLQKIIQKTANYFIGFLFYIFITMIIFDILYFLCKKRISSLSEVTKTKLLYIEIFLQIIIITTVSIYGFNHAKKIYTKLYNVEITKEDIPKENLKVALISDIHLGYSVTSKTMKKIVSIVNYHQVDIILIAGDIFDNSYDALDDVEKIRKSMSQFKSKYGTYAVYGNHDVNEKLIGGFSTKQNSEVLRDKRMDQLLKSSNIRVLEDETILINNEFYLVGRKDASRTGDGVNNRDSIEVLINDLDNNKPIIILEHEPTKLKKISNNNIDLLLSGHTHGGQFFPLSIGTYIKWENPYGYIKKNNIQGIVTSGVGVYGPNMRIGSNSEICIINIKFKRK